MSSMNANDIMFPLHSFSYRDNCLNSLDIRFLLPSSASSYATLTSNDLKICLYTSLAKYGRLMMGKMIFNSFCVWESPDAASDSNSISNLTEKGDMMILASFFNNICCLGLEEENH